MFVLCHFAVLVIESGIAGDYFFLFFICDGKEDHVGASFESVYLFILSSCPVSFFCHWLLCHRFHFIVFRHNLFMFLLFIFI